MPSGYIHQRVSDTWCRQLHYVSWGLLLPPGVSHAHWLPPGVLLPTGCWQSWTLPHRHLRKHHSWVWVTSSTSVDSPSPTAHWHFQKHYLWVWVTSSTSVDWPCPTGTYGSTTREYGLHLPLLLTDPASRVPTEVPLMNMGYIFHFCWLTLAHWHLRQYHLWIWVASSISVDQPCLQVYCPIIAGGLHSGQFWDSSLGRVLDCKASWCMNKSFIPWCKKGFSSKSTLSVCWAKQVIADVCIYWGKQMIFSV